MPLLTMAGTIWAIAELFTAFLFLAQFYANGTISSGILSASYAFSCYLAWPYLAAFPGLFSTGALSLADQQVSLVLWSAWHCTFPMLAMCAVMTDSPLGRIVSRQKIRIASRVIVGAPVVAATLTAALVFHYRETLPLLIASGHFQELWKVGISPVLISVNASACAVLLARRPRTTLALWLAVAIFASTLDVLMTSLTPTRFSYAWDLGKLITVFTAGIVLVMMLSEIAGLYARIARLARVDVLTGLPNRRAFDEHMQVVFANARRLHGSIALLMLDIDHFKRYNDSFGHIAGDECLRRVARALAAQATRPLDMVARYGGEEFVVILPATPLGGAVTIAERMRVAVERLPETDQPGGVTISIGLSHAVDAACADDAELLLAADRALYHAKHLGRNQVARSDVNSASAPELADSPERIPDSAEAITSGN
jgi:diguanylate cyclase (GGDEF)-like protein